NAGVAFSVVKASSPDAVGARDQDDTPVDVVWTDVDGSRGISAGDLLRVFFTEQVASITVDDLEISTGNDLGLGATVAVGAGSFVDVTVGTDATVLSTDTITVGVGVQDVAGTYLEDAATDADNPVALYDDEQPFITQVYLQDENTAGIDANDRLTITFNEPMTPFLTAFAGTVDGTDFVVNGDQGVGGLFGAGAEVLWSADGLTATITLGATPTLADDDRLAIGVAGSDLTDIAGNDGDPSIVAQIVLSTRDYSVTALLRGEYLMDAPNKVGYAIFGINLFENETGEAHVLSSVTVRRSAGTIDFGTDMTFALWRDTNRDGFLDPDTDVYVPSTGNAIDTATYRIELDVAEPLPANDTGVNAGDDWIVVALPKASAAWDDTVTFQIGADDVTLSNLTTYPSAAVDSEAYTLRPSIEVADVISASWAIFSIDPDERLGEAFDDVAPGEPEVVTFDANAGAVADFPNGLEADGSEYRNAVDIVFTGRLTNLSQLTLAGTGVVRVLAMDGDGTTASADRQVLADLGQFTLAAAGVPIALGSVAVEDTDSVHVLRLVNETAVAVSFDSLVATNAGAALRYAAGTGVIVPIWQLDIRNDAAAPVILNSLAPVLTSAGTSFTPEDLTDLAADATSGLLLYAETGVAGFNGDETLVAVPTSEWGYWSTGAYLAHLSTLGEAVAVGTTSYYVAVQLSANAEDGESFSLQLGPGGVAGFLGLGTTINGSWYTVRPGVDDVPLSAALTVDTVAPAIRNVSVTDVDGDWL
ncbi:MAG: hypothetical protein HON70_26405, partial [Lentisphaerae bacterium]|nr:hypothetical protein [Lentisphaerota bacterium]